MTMPIQVTFRDMQASPEVAEYVRTRAAKLETFFDRITACRVVLEAPHHRHHNQGKRFSVHIDLTVPGEELVVGKKPESLGHEDMYACVDEAFDDAGRVLEEYARRVHGVVKRHERSKHGRVKKLFAYEGFGFLETAEGEDVYFHRNSVLHGEFERLKIGDKVRFVPEDGEKGPQASTVDRSHAH